MREGERRREVGERGREREMSVREGERKRDVGERGREKERCR